MKQNHGMVVVLLLLLLLSVSQSSARLLEAISSGGAVEENGIINQAALSSDQTVDFSSLMGTSDVEFGCGDEKDEECVKRRMMAEAHLDYIYTQHHKPKP